MVVDIVVTVTPDRKVEPSVLREKREHVIEESNSCIYLAFACARRGIWDRNLAMNTKTNLITSAIAGIAMGLFNAVMIFKNYHKPVGTIAAAVIVALITFIICFVVLSIMMKETKKRKAAIEAEPEDANKI